MLPDIINIILGFLEGFALIISPCILPVLPIILAGSLTGSKRRPFGIMMGFVILFALGAFFSRQIVQSSGIDINTIRHLAYGLLFTLGIVMLSTYLTNTFNRMAQYVVGTMPGLARLNQPQGGFLSGFIVGGLVAIVWTPCAGPILAAVIVQVVIQKSSLSSFITLLAFGFGVAIPMLLIALYSKQLIHAFDFFKSKSGLFRKLFGALIIASVAFMIYQDIGGAGSAIAPQSSIKVATTLQNELWHPYPAPNIAGIETWINSPPLQLSMLKGKVVLIDFWTFSCINCVRTLPYLKMYYQKYHDKGLVIIGVHTPEFEFEKNPDNVRRAVRIDGIQYPVALDNEFVTWRNFGNHYWPAHYLIDKQGKVVYEHFGEGDYDITENNIRFLLGIDGFVSSMKLNHNQFSFRETPETYLGYAHSDLILSPFIKIRDKPAQYVLPKHLPSGAWGLIGRWNVMADKIVSTAPNDAVTINFHARNVYVVMGNVTQKPIQVDVFLNGKPLLSNQGRDVVHGKIDVDKQSIYEIIALNQAEDGVLQLVSHAPGLALYTFTFGS